MRNLTHILIYVLPVVVSVATLSGCRSGAGPAVVAPQFYRVNDDTGRPTDDEAARTQVQRMSATIAPYKAQLDDRMTRPLATVATPLTKGAPESSLGNWAADLLDAAARATFPDRPIAFTSMNQGGMRVQEIGTGPLLVSEIYELMPFDNELVLLELTGAELTEYVNHIANSGGWPVSGQLSVRRQGGQLSVRLSGQPVDPAAAYVIALPDYVAGGGSGARMLVGKPPVKSGLLVRDLLIEYAAKAEGPIDVRPDGSRMRLD